MSLKYPAGFPETFLPAVIAVEATAQRELLTATASAPRDRGSIQVLVMTYVRTTALSFAHAACDAARAGQWPVTAIDSAVDDFIRYLAVFASFDLDFGVWFSLDKAAAEVKRSPGWSTHLEERRGTAEKFLSAGVPHEQVTTRSGSAMLANPLQAECRSATWRDVTISFLSDERVQITIFDCSWSRNYSEMGFADGRTGTALSAWVLLREIAKHSGTLTNFAKPEKVKKHIQRLRQTLREHVEREHFEIPGDPLPYVRGIGYQSAFKIACAPSFRS